MSSFLLINIVARPQSLSLRAVHTPRKSLSHPKIGMAYEVISTADILGHGSLLFSFHPLLLQSMLPALPVIEERS